MAARKSNLKGQAPGKPYYRPEFCERVLKMVDDAIAADQAPPSKTQMAVALGIARGNFYVWMDKYPEFAAAVEIAENKCQAYFERRAWDIAVGRTDAKPAMMIFLLKCRFAPKDGDRGEHYTDRHEVTGAGGQPFVLKLDASDLAL